MTERPTICLCMIVRNEAPVIARCLRSVMPVIDRWLIVDTGSSDGTQGIVREVMGDLPGQLHERPWRDFASNRSEALALARPLADYSLVIDADDVLDSADRSALAALDADGYHITIAFNGVEFPRLQLFRNARPWRYVGVLHEFPVCDGAVSTGRLPWIIRMNQDGARRRSADTYRKDAELLSRALAGEADPSLRARYAFYLAQSWRDCDEPARALDAYLERAAMGHWDQEVYVSLLEAARLMEGAGYAAEAVIDAYLRAADIRSDRAEALHGASRACRLAGHHARGHAIALRGRDLEAPADGLFVTRWIYDYGLLDEFAVNAYWSGHYRDCLDACLTALRRGRVPPTDHQRFLDNARFALDHMDDKSELSHVGAAAPAARRCPGPLPDPPPRVLLAILAKQKEPVLPLYLSCIEALDYPKSQLVLWIRTNNNTDRTADILRDWLARIGGDYAAVLFDDRDVAARVQEFGVHEWNAARFSVLAGIRNESLSQTIRHGCAFYFVVDLDNFITAGTLRDLVSLNLPIVAPMLRHVDPRSRYANFHADIDDRGYFRDSARYDAILTGRVRGVIEVPVVHCTYLIRADVLPELGYDDASGRHEYVVFAERARARGIPQYIDNRTFFGLLTLNDDAPELIGGELLEIERRVLGAPQAPDSKMAGTEPGHIASVDDRSS